MKLTQMIRYSTKFYLMAKAFPLVGQESSKLDALKRWPICVLHPANNGINAILWNLHKPVCQVSLQGVKLIKNLLRLGSKKLSWGIAYFIHVSLLYSQFCCLAGAKQVDHPLHCLRRCFHQLLMGYWLDVIIPSHKIMQPVVIDRNQNNFILINWINLISDFDWNKCMYLPHLNSSSIVNPRFGTCCLFMARAIG